MVLLMSLSLRSFLLADRTVVLDLDEAVAGKLRHTFGDVVRPLHHVSGYSLLTAVGLALGLIRELAVASTFGLSPELDVFVAVMSLQLFFGAQIGNALETAFVSRVAKQGGASAVSRAVKLALNGLLVVNAGVVLCLWEGAGPLLRTVFHRFNETQQALALHTLHALLLPVVFASTAGLLRGALAVLGSFAPGFVAGSIISLCSILSIVMLAPRLGIDALTLGVAVGNLIVMLLFAARLVRLAPRTRPAPLSRATEGWFTLWGAAGTILLGELIYAAVALSERSLASGLPPGSIAGFFYASTIVSVPLSLVMIPLTTIAFPGMVQAFRRDTTTGLLILRRQGSLLLGLSAVVVAVVSVFSESIVELVFMRGEFVLDHARFTASILSITIFALPCMSLSRLIRNGCYAVSDYRTPAIGVSLQLGALAGMGWLLTPRYGAQGLAIATVMGEAAAMLIMMLRLIRKVRPK
jgi:putative peptidoglycan lipid II flippase